MTSEKEETAHMPNAILDPTGRTTGRRLTALAPRRPDLGGVTVGLLENRKHNAGLFLRELGRVLVERHGAAGVLLRDKASIVLPAPDEVMDELASQRGAVIVGVGD
ncbi:MAG TPA: hypothetical protein VKF59_08325 [Candidatus Dormibacteraeota bacterium]|nr:hypothetical protein [Candidatus Dormibacteraeota bacterium]